MKGLVEVEERMKMFSFLGALMKGLAVELLWSVRGTGTW